MVEPDLLLPHQPRMVSSSEIYSGLIVEMHLELQAFGSTRFVSRYIVGLFIYTISGCEFLLVLSLNMPEDYMIHELINFVQFPDL